jgi:hypothetical protein
VELERKQNAHWRRIRDTRAEARQRQHEVVAASVRVRGVVLVVGSAIINEQCVSRFRVLSVAVCRAVCNVSACVLRAVNARTRRTDDLKCGANMAYYSTVRHYGTALRRVCVCETSRSL